MTTLTIEIPDAEIDEVVKYLQEKQIIIKTSTFKTLDELTIDDYRKDAFMRSKNRRGSASKYL